MRKGKINSASENTPRCNNCRNFGGISPSFSKGAPPAWCNPPWSKWATPCEPGGNASDKPCYSPK